jgi:hypothetical protein
MFAASVALCIALGIVLRAEALHGTFFGDDWDHYAMFAGLYPAKRDCLDYFDFVAGEYERNELLRAGRLPWWTSPDIRLAVLRPFASALTWADFGLLQAQEYPWTARLHSFVWWVVLICGAAALLTRVLPLSTASIAIAFYAVHKSHALPLTWNANRSELVAIACVYWGTWAHLRWRASEGWWFRVSSIVLIAFGILAGEHALPPLAYLVLSELNDVNVTRTAGSAARALAPFATLTLGFLILRHWLGYGLLGSSFYVDPLAEPLRFLVATYERFPLMVGDVALGIPGEWFYVGAPWREELIALELVPRAWLSIARLGAIQQSIGWVAVIVILTMIVKLRRSSQPVHRSLSWLLLAALGTLLLGCGTLAFSRMTMAAGLGFCSLWAVIGGELWTCLRERTGWRVRAFGALGLLTLLAAHGAHAAYRTHHETMYFAGSSRRELATALNADLPGELPKSHVFVIRALDWLSQFALPYALHMHGRPIAESYETLLPLSLAPIEVKRVSSHELDISVSAWSEGFVFGRSVYALEDVSFTQGQSFVGARFSVGVAQVSLGMPTKLRFTFRHDIDDGNYVFLYPFKSGLRRVTLPPIGKAFTLPAPVAPRLNAP